MLSPQPSAGQRQAFAEYVANCQFFDDRGYLDLEKFCMHLYLSLFCDSAPAPEPIALYELMLKQVGKIKNRKKLEKIYKQYVPDWKESQRSYYPDEQRTSIHFDLLAEVYSTWILQVGTELLKYPNRHKEKGRFWIKPEWPLTTLYVQRFELELVRLAGMARFLGASAFQ